MGPKKSRNKEYSLEDIYRTLLNEVSYIKDGLKIFTAGARTAGRIRSMSCAEIGG